MSGVDCVVAMGAPADSEPYQAEVRRSNGPDRLIIAEQMAITPEDRSPTIPSRSPARSPPTC